ncbi:hypothetical protein GCM10025865_33820 (plasmid) [Paraoerskovia sediminicola]|uniref:DUF4192 domain-containing protein n=1 Tax=Paraoerskovia sediminicola TaxID=1138587 RepID=A0ABN6XGR3_9CELL|nr:DUF4192 domain-containing protein [Paraoerskovia sediminicola]BDZ44039.1 hypothetical protein GCM10025865_33380 [Paraoerskovia sediminicola]BDZ44083.1 hypothetical protein GCM10025865_33820 [Paraoerskovia sediminicola]
MTQPIIVSGTREILAYLPIRLGYTPTESLVVVAVRGDRRIGVVARMDLDDVTEVHAETLAQQVNSDHPTTVLAAIYTEDTDRAHAAIDRTAKAFGGYGLDVREAWQVTSTDYRDLYDPTAKPEPVEDFKGTQVAAEAVATGHVVRDSLADLLPTPADAGAHAAARQAGETFRTDVGTGTDAPTFGYAVWTLALTGVTSGPETYGTLAEALTDVPTRDALIVAMVPGTPEDVIAQTLANTGGDAPGVGAAMRAIIDGAEGVRPGDEADKMRDLLTQVIAHADSHQSAAAWTLWALIEWWHGNSATAREALTRAQASEPYRLAQLLSGAIATGMPPGWVIRER